jgi:hypothetical protein
MIAYARFTGNKKQNLFHQDLESTFDIKYIFWVNLKNTPIIVYEGRLLMIMLSGEKLVHTFPPLSPKDLFEMLGVLLDEATQSRDFLGTNETNVEMYTSYLVRLKKHWVSLEFLKEKTCRDFMTCLRIGLCCFTHTILELLLLSDLKLRAPWTLGVV